MKIFKIIIGCIAILLGLGVVTLGVTNVINQNWVGVLVVFPGIVLLLAGWALITNRSLKDFFESIFTNPSL